MTKAIRIENADNSIYKVVVKIWEKGTAGNALVQEILLNNPCDMTNGVYLTSTRYITIEEA